MVETYLCMYNVCALMWIVLLYNLKIALLTIFATVASVFDPLLYLRVTFKNA